MDAHLTGVVTAPDKKSHSFHQKVDGSETVYNFVGWQESRCEQFVVVGK